MRTPCSCAGRTRWADAEPYFRRAADNATYATPEVALTNAGVCARDAGEPEEAAENFRAALDAQPELRRCAART